MRLRTSFFQGGLYLVAHGLLLPTEVLELCLDANQPLGRTILGPTAGDLDTYIRTNYTADRMVLVDTGGVDHTELVKLAEKHFSSIPVSSHPLALGTPAGPKTSFVGSEVCLRDDELAHSALAPIPILR
ncbi:hypothetical protein B0H11DRAFT_2259667 [Mycena galericulata]|nr:hypothetical protein B0H11DRAFT_2259667 [Mycena galericulata]